MRTRNTVKVSGGNGNNTQKRKYTRQPRNKSHTTANRNSGLDDFQPEQTQVSIAQINDVPVLSVKEESKTSDEPPNCRNLKTEFGADVVSNLKTEPSNQLLQQREASESLVLFAGSLNQVKNEVIDTENQGSNVIEGNDITAYSSLGNNESSTIVYPYEAKPESNVTALNAPNPATCTSLPKTENLFNSQPNQKPSCFNGAYKLYRFMVCEWFYSHIDRPLFAVQSYKKCNLSTMLKEHYPSLFTRSLNRIQWNYIRMKLPKERPVRRLSHAFLHHERINLERRREKLRFLMEDSMFEYLDDDIPSAIPKPIDIGSTVRGTTFIPHYGSHTGQVIGVENRNIPLFRVRFRNDSEQLIPDYRVALEQFFHIAEALDTVSVTSKHLKQIALQEINLIEKFRLLHALENIRLNLAARHATGFLNAVQDKEQIEAYDQTVRKLMHLNRNLLQLMKQISTDYEQYMAEPLTANDEDDVPVVDKYVMDEANQLLAAYTKLDQIDNSPVADLLWRETMQRLHRRPEYLQQFEAYLASNIGMIFDVTSRSLR